MEAAVVGGTTAGGFGAFCVVDCDVVDVEEVVNADVVGIELGRDELLLATADATGGTVVFVTVGLFVLVEDVVAGINCQRAK